MERLILTAPVRRIRLADYVSLTKPRIIVLLVVTAICAMVPAAHGLPAWPRILSTSAGLTLSVGGAHAVNMWYDRDIDAVMERTRNRPVPSGRIAPLEALSFGVFLESVSFVWLSLAVNQLTAALCLAGFLFYVLVYTVWLKRRSVQNIVIGGAAGAFPPLVGWSAVAGHLGWTPVMMFLTIFLWTPPHFWALALVKQEDYRRAGLPMLPVVQGEQATTRQMLVYSVLLWATSLGLYWTDPSLGLPYLATAIVLGAAFSGAVAALAVRWVSMPPKRVFGISLWYTAGLFSAMVAGTLWH